MDRILDARSKLTVIMDSLTPPSIPPMNADIRLPRLTLPIFEGRLEEWSVSRDMFITTLLICHQHRNSHI